MDKPILFSGPMVRAILDGKKTMTRRVIKAKPFLEWIDAGFSDEFIKNPANCMEDLAPYQPGTRLWVKETHYRYGYWAKNGKTKTGKQKYRFKALSDEVRYFDNPPDRIERHKEIIGWFKRPSIFMPRWASRITLEVIDRRYEPLQDISHKDALAEGVEYDVSKENGSPLARFHILWDSINGKKHPWASNPFVWVYEFRRVPQ